jgi:metallophosphoesterase (TIGR00282 family)
VVGNYDKYGVGTRVVKVKNKNIRITNLIGKTVYRFESSPNPFLALDSVVLEDKSDIHIVDFHAEATGEKNALALDFDGKVSAVLGTHTHVQTADARILKKGTAYITDAGMTGPFEGVIGAKPEVIIQKQRNDTTFVLEVASGIYQISYVVLVFDDLTNKCKSISNGIIIEDNK